ncbi:MULTISPECIES: DNA polymerase III subunit delta [Mogibacterium]|uniref:DNA polymerase III subunit delta n=1 Tax=Mogibacterium TaxID=86331 RepID=UPI0017B937AD|nr:MULTISPECIES: DNA polymerase III subunit delta [Mogibacterium]MBB1533602.1 DNA polymerase III subunit delta [Mogibacterium sp.]
MSFKEFSKDIKSGVIGSNIFLYGEEGFLTDWAVKRIAENNSSEADRKYVVTDLDGATVTAQEIVETANTMTMFASTRVLTVKNYQPLIKKSAVTETAPILEYLSNPNPSTILLFYLEPLVSPGKREKLNAFASKVSGLCSTYNFERLNPAELKSFVNKRIRSAGKLIGARDMDYLVDISGYLNNDSEYDLYRMESDLTKLVNASDEDTVSKQLIEEIMVGDKDRFVFNFIDYLLAGKKNMAMQLLINTISAGENSKGKGNVFSLASTLIGQFEIMYDSLELDDEGMPIKTMAKSLRVNEYRLKKAYAAARKVGKSKIKKALIELYDTDRLLKTGEMDKNTSLELFVFNW